MGRGGSENGRESDKFGIYSSNKPKRVWWLTEYGGEENKGIKEEDLV